MSLWGLLYKEHHSGFLLLFFKVALTKRASYLVGIFFSFAHRVMRRSEFKILGGEGYLQNYSLLNGTQNALHIFQDSHINVHIQSSTCIWLEINKLFQ